MSSTLHESILRAGDLVHPSYPTDFYLNPVDKRIESFTVIGAGIPVPAYNGIWVKIFQAPANAIPDSVVENLLAIESLLEADCENNFVGTEWNGRNYVGVWRDTPNYSFCQQFDIAAYWPADDWFQPIINNLKEKWESGMNATQIIDSEDLGDTINGMVDYDEAVAWLEEQIKEWEEEKEDDEEDA